MLCFRHRQSKSCARPHLHERAFPLLGTARSKGDGSLKISELGLKHLPQNVHEGRHHLVLLRGAKAAMELDVALFRDRKRYFPGPQGPRFRALAELLPSHLHIDPVKAEFAMSAPQYVPAILGCRGCGEALFQVFDRDVRIEKPAKGAVNEQAASDTELDVAQVLNADPGAHTKREDDEARH